MLVFSFYLPQQSKKVIFLHIEKRKTNEVLKILIRLNHSFPDVMMQSFSINRWYAIYFVCYLSTMLYVMMNLMLAVVNETFTSAERDKFKKLFLHKRKACQHAFKLLVSKQSPDQMRFKQFEGLMRYYSPQKCKIIERIFKNIFNCSSFQYNK